MLLCEGDAEMPLCSEKRNWRHWPYTYYLCTVCTVWWYCNVAIYKSCTGTCTLTVKFGINIAVVNRQAGALAVMAVLAIASQAEFPKHSVHSFSLESFLSSLSSFSSERSYPQSFHSRNDWVYQTHYRQRCQRERKRERKRKSESGLFVPLSERAFCVVVYFCCQIVGDG